MIRALLFDLGDVLVKLDHDRVYRAAAAHCGKAPEEVRRLLAESGVSFPYERGEIDCAELHRRCESLLGLGLDFQAFADLWSDMFSGDELLSPDLLQALGRRYNLAIVSNTNTLHYERIRREYPVVDLFPLAILSYEVGSMKPSPEIFRAALEAVGSRPEECFFIDDRAENVEGARKLGIQANLFRGQAALEEAMREAGVRW
jgi:putative hydrolase of the HAD superfamily